MMSKKKRRTSLKESEDWFPENKGKVRGWKRRFDQLDNYIPCYEILDLGKIERFGMSRVILPSPWYNLVKRNPPTRYRRKWVKTLLIIHNMWKAQLDGFGKPYYLGLWLFDERFHDTQLVAAVGPKIEHYNSVFADAEVEKPPPSVFCRELESSSEMGWRSCIDHAVHFQSDFDEGGWTEVEIAKALSNVDERILDEDGDTMYFVRQGRLWVGQYE